MWAVGEWALSWSVDAVEDVCDVVSGGVLWKDSECVCAWEGEYAGSSECGEVANG